MKKYGRYEKRPEDVPEKQPKVKSVLLQTYLTSLLCMVLCVTMFFGTTYAWFTSEVQNTGNEIYIGTLDVGLYDGENKDLAGADPLFDGGIRWEPGYTALETIQVVNEGDLAFNYALTFTEGKLNDVPAEASAMAAVADWFEVWVYAVQADAAFTKPESYKAMSAKDSGWELAGTLTEILNGKNVLLGAMEAVRDESTAETSKNTTIDGTDTTHTYMIALHMKEDAQNSEENTLMNKKISLNVKLTAYQRAKEPDDIGSTYDQMVLTANELKAALANGGTVVLADSIELRTAEERASMNGGVLDGNGKTITYAGDKVNGYSAGVVTTSGGQITNLTVTGANGRAIYVTNLTEDLVVSNCTLDGAYSFNYTSSTDSGKNLYFTNTTFKSWTSYANAVAGAFFTDCTFEGNLRPYASTTLTKCKFNGENAKLDISKLENGEEIILNSCTLNDGSVVTTENVDSIIDSNGRAYAVSDSDNQIKLTISSAGTVNEN